MAKGFPGTRTDCSEEECTKISVGRGLCRKHYQRWYYSQNKKKVIAMVQKYQRDNRDKLNEYRRAYYWKNHDRIRKYHKDYHETKKEE